MRPLLLASLLLAHTPSFAQDLTSYSHRDEARAAARESGKDILIEFTGTGWCGYCQDMRKRLFGLEAFREWMAADYLWLEVDYVLDQWRLQALPRDQVQHHQDLRQSYQVRLYPTIILCDADGLPYAMKEGFTPDASTEEYFFQLGQLTGNRKIRDDALARAAASKGAKRHQAIEEALAVVPPRCLEAFYPELFAELRKHRPESTLVKAFEHERELATVESGLRRLLADKKFDQVLDETDDLMDGGVYEGEELQRFLLVRARALAGLKKRKEATEVVARILEIKPGSQYAGRARGVLRQLSSANVAGDGGENLEAGGMPLPRSPRESLKALHALLKIEGEDLSARPFSVLKRYGVEAAEALRKVQEQVEKEHKQWEELYFRKQALVRERGAGDPGAAEYDRIIGDLKAQHEITHRRERELSAFTKRVKALASERFEQEQAAEEAAAQELLEEAEKLRDEAAKLLEKKS